MGDNSEEAGGRRYDASDSRTVYKKGAATALIVVQRRLHGRVRQALRIKISIRVRARGGASGGDY